MNKFLFFILTLITLLVINYTMKEFFVDIPEENSHLYFQLRNEMGQDFVGKYTDENCKNISSRNPFSVKCTFNNSSNNSYFNLNKVLNTNPKRLVLPKKNL